MPNDLVDGVLYVPAGNPFRWVEVPKPNTDDGPALYLTDGKPTSTDKPPHEDPLFYYQKIQRPRREWAEAAWGFSKLDGLKAIEDFANYWGNLGAYRSKKIPIPGSDRTSLGVEISTWNFQIRRVRKIFSGEMPLNEALLAVNTQLNANMRVQLIQEAGEDRPIVRMSPRNLSGAIWLYVGKYLGGEIDFVKCRAPECANWVQNIPANRGTKKMYCSTNCSQQGRRAGLGSPRRKLKNL